MTAGDRRLAVSGGAWIGFRDAECGAACSRVAASLSTPGVDAVLCLSQNRAFELVASGRRIRVSLGEHHSFTAVMKDDAFNSRIVAGDILVVDLRVALLSALATSPLVCAETVEADLVVVGSGHAGLAGALQATE